MTSCPHCHADLLEAARFCPECGGPLAAADARADADPVRLEVNRNRLYMKDRSGLLEFRVSNRHPEIAITAVLVMEATVPEHLGAAIERQLRVAGGGTSVSRIPVDPRRAGELLFGVRLTCRSSEGTLQYAADGLVLRVNEPTASAQSLAITIDNSVSAGGDMSAISNRTQSDLGRQILELARAGAGVNDLLDRNFPDRWEAIELVAEEAGIGDLDEVLGLKTSGDDLLRQAAWDVLADGKVTADEKRKLDAIVRKHGIPQERAHRIVAEVQGQSQREREHLHREAEEAAHVVKSERELRALLGKQAKDRVADWKRWADLGWPEAQWLLGECLRVGAGLQKSDDAARRSVQLAADAGVQGAAYRLKHWKPESEAAHRPAPRPAAPSRPEPPRAAVAAPKPAPAAARAPASPVPPKAPPFASSDRDSLYVYDPQPLASLARPAPPAPSAPSPGGATISAERERWQADSEMIQVNLCKPPPKLLSPPAEYPVGTPAVVMDDVTRYERLAALLKIQGGQTYNEGHMKYVMGFSATPDEKRRWVSSLLALDESTLVSLMWPVSMYELARGAETLLNDEARAITWYRHAAERGHVIAMIALANHLSSKGQNKYDLPAVQQPELVEALRWYRKAADAGHPAGMASVGWLNVLGFGTAKNAAEAARWFRKAAGFHHAEAIAAIGTMFELGKGVPKNEPIAQEWFMRGMMLLEGNFDATRERVAKDLRLFL
ncbi:MAG TPA: zinc-ribbon domain-containing protein [Vicinamibacterales bacterium]|jgi:TPR repeat protein|nr:zinc-ribbon domain-containing protein [Vicinamibacterales bacterium]